MQQRKLEHLKKRRGRFRLKTSQLKRTKCAVCGKFPTNCPNPNCPYPVEVVKAK